MRNDYRPIETQDSPGERVSSAISSLISMFSLAGVLGVLGVVGTAIYWIGSLAVGFFTRGSWLALSVLGVGLVFGNNWSQSRYICPIFICLSACLETPQRTGT